MAQQLSFDTTFLIDLQRERLRPEEGTARRFLAQHSGTLMFLSAVALGEFCEGFENPEDGGLWRLLGAIQVLEVDQPTALLYGSIARELRVSGRLIGSNDLWIGCSAVRFRLPLVTRNENHFRRIPGLQVIQY